MKKPRSAAEAATIAVAREPYRVLNCEPSPKQETDWGFAAALKSGLTDTALPISVDHRADWWEIGDQGQTGSCVGWATGDAVLRWHFTRAGLIRPQDHLSVRFLWMAAKETDEFTSTASSFLELAGTSLKAALDIARKYGAVLDDVLPFGSGQLFQDEETVFYATAARLKIASYINLGRNPGNWRRWLANNGPILTRLDVDSTWWNATQTAGRLDAYDTTALSGGHAVAIVGYDADGFIIRNSWSEAWGDQGFAYASNAYAQAAFTEAYGVTVSGSVAAPDVAGAFEAALLAQPAAFKFAPAAAAPATAGETTRRRIEASVDDQATWLLRRPVSLDQTVKDAFPDMKGLDKLLGCVQDDLSDLQLRLTTRPAAEKAKQLAGTYYALAQWIYGIATGASQ